MIHKHVGCFGKCARTRMCTRVSNVQAGITERHRKVERPALLLGAAVPVEIDCTWNHCFLSVIDAHSLCIFIFSFTGSTSLLSADAVCSLCALNYELVCRHGTLQMMLLIQCMWKPSFPRRMDSNACRYGGPGVVTSGENAFALFLLT